MGIDPLSSISMMKKYQEDVGEFDSIPAIDWNNRSLEDNNMAGEMTAREVEGRLARIAEPMRFHSNAPQHIRDAFTPSELWDMMRIRGMSHSDVDLLVRKIERDQRRRMEMTTSAPIFMEDARQTMIREMDDTFRRALSSFDPSLLPEPKSKFPEYSEEKFENIGKEPIVKDIMPGMVKLTKKQQVERIKLYLNE